MKAVVAVLLLLVVVASAIDQATIQSFIQFQHQYGKFYQSSHEYNYRLAVFNNNVQAAAKLQATTNVTTFGVTKFMDMTPKEFKQNILMSKLSHKEDPKNGPYTPFQATVKAPSSFDWRSRPGVVTPVYNQGQCGSCWAFSATENIESQYALAGHPLKSLSQQQIVSCDTADYGCEGGWPYNAYKYIMSAGGQELYSDYPYTAETGTCQFNAAYIYAKINGWQYVTQNQNEQEMVNYLVANGPLSICVDAEPWQYYTSGVLTAANCGTSIDHCVEAVGYNTASSTPYWIVRNSWGTDWGNAGYIWLQYGQDTCAMAQVVTNSHADK